jgi:hypothetical protein
MSPPPLPPKKTTSHAWLIVLAAVLLLLSAIGYGLVRVYRTVTHSDIVGQFDRQFGDQHIKTAVALIELHKVRNGRYPEDLGKLRHTGPWDLIALQNVRYVAAPDGASYFVEVQRGWIGKPALELPSDFWQGTGYNPKLAERK